MRKYVFFASVLVALVGVDCSTDYSNYQCKSNNECGEGSEGQTSCAVDTSKCVPVQPINVTDNNNWRSPKVGQTNFSVKLEASGGHPPYSWEFAIVGQPKDKLDWLTLKEDESDNKVNAWLTHKPQSGPTKATESGDTLEIKVSVRDNTKFDPLDNNVGI